MRKISGLVLGIGYGVLSIVYGVVCVNIIGCASMRSKDSSASSPFLEPQATMKFTDIPVPAGFKLLPQDSYSFESAGVRVGILKYQGKAEPDKVAVFFKEQMPMYNWTLLNAMEYGQRLLNFERDQESCIITMDNKGRSVTLTISVGPKAAVKKAASKPVK